MRLLLICSILVAGVVNAEGEVGLDSEYKEETHERIRYLERQVNTYNHLVRKLSSELQELLSEQPESISVSCGPDPDFDFTPPDPEWQTPDAPQRAHDAGFQRIILVPTYSESLCAPLEITRDGIRIGGFSANQGNLFEKISLLGADNIRIGDIQTNEFEVISSSVDGGDFYVMDKGKIIDSRMRMFIVSGFNNVKIIGSSVEVEGATFWDGDTEVINSYIGMINNDFTSVRGRMILRSGSYFSSIFSYQPSEPIRINFGPGGELICDPQTSRVFGRPTVQASFQPPQIGNETCIISEPYE